MDTVLQTQIAGTQPIRGKVRDIYDLGESLLIVASDRLSAFDVIMTNVNYYDRCNFPLIEEQLLPLAQERGQVGAKAGKQIFEELRVTACGALLELVGSTIEFGSHAANVTHVPESVHPST